MFENKPSQMRRHPTSRSHYCWLIVIAARLLAPSALAQGETSFFVPIVLSTSGENGSFFTSELTLTNRGATNVTLDYGYTAAFGGGSGTASDSILAGRQKVVPDAIVYLKSLGVPIPDSGDRSGTLRVQAHNLASPLEFGITVRTTTPEPEGRAGLAYTALRPSEALNDPVYLFGLRQDASDRSNLALQNMGTHDQGDIMLQVTVISGDPSQPLQKTLPKVILHPGGWYQFAEILHSSGLSLNNGYVLVERVQGTAPYYAYAVINDNANSDGCFISPITESTIEFRQTWTLPVVVHTTSFSSELIITNVSSNPMAVTLGDVKATNLKPGEQVIIPDVVQYLRDHGSSKFGTTGEPWAGALSANACSVDDCTKTTSGAFYGVRTSRPGGGGRYGVFYNAIPAGGRASGEAWLYDLQQDGENRTNLALVNTEASGEATFRCEIFDGDTGEKVNTIDGISVSAGQWTQIGNVLSQSSSGTTQGYAHVTETTGSNSFIAYAVVNDGGQPTTGTGDATLVTNSLPSYQPLLQIEPRTGIEFCPGSGWTLKLSNAPPNTAVHLIDQSTGVIWDLPEGASTDALGTFTKTGAGSLDGDWVIEVGGVLSNPVSLQFYDDCE